MAKSNPLVSVVVPVWNAGANLESLTRQLLEQTYQNLEIIAVDDGSTDDSPLVLEKLAKKDKRIKVLHQKNAGASAARNAGIAAASGKYVVFVDADDGVVENYVEKLVRAVEAEPDVALAVVGMRMNKLYDGSVVNVHTEPRRKRRPRERMVDYFLELLLRDGRMHSSVNKIFRLETLKKDQIRFEEGRDFAEDTKFVLDYLEHTPGEIEFILEPLYIYNFGTETSTVRASSTVWKNWQKNYLELKDWVKKTGDGKIHLKTRVLLGLVWLRWRISHHRAQKRAKVKHQN